MGAALSEPCMRQMTLASKGPAFGWAVLHTPVALHPRGITLANAIGASSAAAKVRPSERLPWQTSSETSLWSVQVGVHE